MHPSAARSSPPSSVRACASHTHHSRRLLPPHAAGGLKKPLLGTSYVSLDKRVSAEIASSSSFLEAPGTATVETWENNRWYPVVGWTPQTLPTDPPHWSSAALPFRELPKDSSEFDLPSAVRSTRIQGLG